MTTALQDLNQTVKDLGASKVVIVSGDANNPVFQSVQGANSLTLTSDVAVKIPALTKSFQAFLTGNGAISANISILVSDFTNADSFVEIATMSPAGTNKATDYVPPMQYSWTYTKIVISNLTAGATCEVRAGY